MNKTPLIELCLEKKVLCFGDFTLKSGRQCPYFFNAGHFDSGAAMWQLAQYYAQTIVDQQLEFDVLFGPAYKGIPLVSVTAACLAVEHGIDKPFCFNRKTAKDHGEGGVMVGAPLQGKVLVIDDVMTAGTAVRESVALIDQAGSAQLAGVLVALDRQERGTGKRSAVQEVQLHYQVPVVSVLTLADILVYLEAHGECASLLSSVQAYQLQYGV